MKQSLIGVDLALAVRAIAIAAKSKAPLGNYGFMCPECKQPVKPFEDGMQGPHFEHIRRNSNCSLSDT